VTKVVFIGRDLDIKELGARFEKCKAKELRFKTGNKVEYWINGEFVPGSVLRCWDDGNPYFCTPDNPELHEEN